jgi:hypothetical protein
MSRINGDLALGLGVAAVIIAVAIAAYMDRDTARLCIQQHGQWKNNTCTFKEIYDRQTT